MKVRFLAWSKTPNPNSDDIGHITMMDYTDGVALEYGMVGPTLDLLPAVDQLLKTSEAKQAWSWPGKSDPKLSGSLVSPRFGNDSFDADVTPELSKQVRPLFVIGGTEGFQTAWQNSKVQGPQKIKKFEWVHWIDVEITPSELSTLEERAAFRTVCGRYEFTIEAIAALRQQGEFEGTRCLSVLEDLAEIRGMKLKKRTAYELLLEFAANVSARTVETISILRSRAVDYQGYRSVPGLTIFVDVF